MLRSTHNGADNGAHAAGQKPDPGAARSAATAEVVEHHLQFTVMTLCQASGARTDDVRALVIEGVLDPIGTTAADWQFSGGALGQTRRALRLMRDFELGISGVALVMDLLAEIDRLRTHAPTL